MNCHSEQMHAQMQLTLSVSNVRLLQGFSKSMKRRHHPTARVSPIYQESCRTSTIPRLSSSSSHHGFKPAPPSTRASRVQQRTFCISCFRLNSYCLWFHKSSIRHGVWRRLDKQCERHTKPLATCADSAMCPGSDMARK